MKRLEELWMYVDPGARTSEGLQLAIEIARRSQATLTLVGALGRPADPIFKTPLGADLRRIIHEDRTAHLAELEGQARAALPAGRVAARLLEGEVAWHTVIEHAVMEEPDLVLLPAPLAGDDRIDSIAHHFFRKCPAPVWAIAPGAAGFPRRILAAIDPGAPGSDERRLAREVLDAAAGLAAGGAAELHVAHAYHFLGEAVLRTRFGPRAADEYLERTRELAQEAIDALVAESAARPSVAGVHVVHGAAPQIVPALADRLDAGLVVLGTAARTGLSGFLIGSTAESIILRLSRSVAVVKHPAFLSPVKPHAAHARPT